MLSVLPSDGSVYLLVVRLTVFFTVLSFQTTLWIAKAVYGRQICMGMCWTLHPQRIFRGAHCSVLQNEPRTQPFLSRVRPSLD